MIMSGKLDMLDKLKIGNKVQKFCCTGLRTVINMEAEIAKDNYYYLIREIDNNSENSDKKMQLCFGGL